MRLGLQHSYAGLPSRFYARIAPTRVPDPTLVIFNTGLARELGLDPDALEPEAAALLSGNALPEDADPIAMAYAGHQFGGFVPSLGDGRAILLGEIQARDGSLRDIQLKGAGRTPFSRGGDGRAALGPMLREYLVSEAMHALGVATTRSLAVVTTGEQVYRESALPGAVLTRVAASHVRVVTDIDGPPALLHGSEDPPGGWIAWRFEEKVPTNTVVWRERIQGNTRRRTMFQLSVNPGDKS